LETISEARPKIATIPTKWDFEGEVMINLFAITCAKCGQPLVRYVGKYVNPEKTRWEIYHPACVRE
jgi:hypothetical protein